MMNNTQRRRRAIDLFLHSLGHINVDDNGLRLANDMADLNAVALLTTAVRAHTADCHTVEDIILRHLVDVTQELIVSLVVRS